MDERPVHKEVSTGHSRCGYVSFSLRYEREHGDVTCVRCLRALEKDAMLKVRNTPVTMVKL